MIPFTRRELERAWRQTRSVAKTTSRTNAHRLLLFYATECGLKAVYLKRECADVYDKTTSNKESFGHDLNKVMDRLRVGKVLRLASNLELHPYKSQTNKKISRKFSCCDLNQAWRYGGTLIDPSCDKSLEEQLERVDEWIEGELQ